MFFAALVDHRVKIVWVGKVIHWKLSMKFKFDKTTKRYMHKPESVLENEMHKILRDFEIQSDHLILTRRPDLVIVNKKKEKKKKKKKKKEPAELWTLLFRLTTG